jgi:hypothetical protein
MRNKVTERRIWLYNKCLEYKGNKCEYCGSYGRRFHVADWGAPITGFRFHYYLFKGKHFGIPNNPFVNFDSLKSVLDECMLLCASCDIALHKRTMNRIHKSTSTKSRELEDLIMGKL